MARKRHARRHERGPSRARRNNPMRGADAKGTATATLRFDIPGSERVCPAGGSRPWYVQSGEWTAHVTDTAHGLRLVGPPDLVIGP